MISKKQSKFIKSLKIKKYRDSENAFIVEGRKNVLELVKSDYEIKILVGTQMFIDSNPKLSNKNFEVIVSSESELSQLGTFKSNSECLAVAVKKKNHINLKNLSGITFLLDDIGDPGNLGTIIRTLDWFGFGNLICSEHCADLYNPKVINSSMGSFTRMNVYYTDLAEFILKSDISVYGADMNGEELTKTRFTSPAFIVMGSESNGLSENIRSLLTSAISISGYGKAESLNVGVATGIICHHLRNINS
ncbi:MAG: TrmH family RNA methyltransferase [Bacteroidota bacterium]